MGGVVNPKQFLGFLRIGEGVRRYPRCRGIGATIIGNGRGAIRSMNGNASKRAMRPTPF